MKSRLLQASLLIAAAFTTLIAVAVAVENWVLAAIGGATLGGAVLIVAADANRQVRAVRRRMQRMAREGVRRPDSEPPQADVPSDQGETQPPPVQVERADVLGAVRVLQAQYTARLDRLQDSVEEALEELRRASAGPPEVASPRPPDGLTHPSPGPATETSTEISPDIDGEVDERP